MRRQIVVGRAVSICLQPFLALGNTKDASARLTGLIALIDKHAFYCLEFLLAQKNSE